MSDTTARQAPDQRQRELFRISPIALFGAAALAWCATPFAFGAPGLQLIYLLPIGLAWWVIRRRTTVDTTGIQVREVFGGTRVDWSQVRGLRLGKKSTVHVVREEGAEVRLPTVRPRDLPRLAALSGGRLPDLTAAEQAIAGSDVESRTADSTDPTASDSSGSESDSPAPDSSQHDRPDSSPSDSSASDSSPSDSSATDFPTSDSSQPDSSASDARSDSQAADSQAADSATTTPATADAEPDTGSATPDATTAAEAERPGTTDTGTRAD
ncbi:hypothetical protein FHR81_004269 [Actinoalloteichus hoggarensis]|nr:PH domain-containing protein [Actinoalloteichus hoggarensis]MBB5923202.1 hypothetical protein [Actinoalloteichus hoggarensis]